MATCMSRYVIHCNNLFVLEGKSVRALPVGSTICLNIYFSMYMFPCIPVTQRIKKTQTPSMDKEEFGPGNRIMGNLATRLSEKFLKGFISNKKKCVQD